MRDYKKIKAWSLADQLAIKIYEITKKYPKEEMYGLISQMRRAAVSVPANIAEGSARNSHKEYLQFLFIARSSARELDYYAHLSYKLGYIGDLKFRILSDQCSETLRVLFGLIQAVSNDNLNGLQSAVSRLQSKGRS